MRRTAQATSWLILIIRFDQRVEKSSKNLFGLTVCFIATDTSCLLSSNGACLQGNPYYPFSSARSLLCLILLLFYSPQERNCNLQNPPFPHQNHDSTTENPASTLIPWNQNRRVAKQSSLQNNNTTGKRPLPTSLSHCNIPPDHE